MSNNFRKYPKTKARKGLSSTSLQIQGLEFLFSNSGTFKDFQVLYKLCYHSFLPSLISFKTESLYETRVDSRFLARTSVINGLKQQRCLDDVPQT
jgi:hypothetical protein